MNNNDWFAGDVDADGNKLMTVRVDSYVTRLAYEAVKAPNDELIAVAEELLEYMDKQSPFNKAFVNQYRAIIDKNKSLVTTSKL